MIINTQNIEFIGDGGAKPGGSLLKKKSKTTGQQSKSVNINKNFDWIRNEAYKKKIADNVNSKVNPNSQNYRVVDTQEFNKSLNEFRVKSPNRKISFDNQTVTETEINFLNALIANLQIDEPELYNWIIQNKFDLVGYLRAQGEETLRNMQARDVYIGIAKNMQYPKANEIEEKYSSPGLTNLFKNFSPGKFFTDNWIWIAGAGVAALVLIMITKK